MSEIGAKLIADNRGFMNFASYLTAVNSSCFFELRGDGQILYSRFRRNKSQTGEISELAGQNFFDEFTDFENVEDFQRIFNKFAESKELSDNFVFECRFGETILPIRVMFLRAFENPDLTVERGIILDIRNNSH